MLEKVGSLVTLRVVSALFRSRVSREEWRKAQGADAPPDEASFLTVSQHLRRCSAHIVPCTLESVSQRACSSAALYTACREGSVALPLVRHKQAPLRHHDGSPPQTRDGNVAQRQTRYMKTPLAGGSFMKKPLARGGPAVTAAPARARSGPPGQAYSP